MPFTRIACTAFLTMAAAACPRPSGPSNSTKSSPGKDLEVVRHLKVTFGVERTIYHPPPDLTLRER